MKKFQKIVEPKAVHSLGKQKQCEQKIPVVFAARPTVPTNNKI